MSGNEGTLFIGGASRRVTPRLVTIGRDEKGGGLESRQRFSGGLSSLLSVLPRRERERVAFLTLRATGSCIPLVHCIPRRKGSEG